MSTIGRYEYKEKLGEGGMAQVLLCFDPYMQREVAVKVMTASLNQDPDFRKRFEREAVVIASLEHAYIVPVYDFGYIGDQPYLVMRYLMGGSLKERLEDYGPLSLTEAAAVMERMASALDEAHNRGIVHRDVKPDNMLLDRQGSAYLNDFGLVKIVTGGASGTKGNWYAGTPAYMAPEQIHGNFPVDARTDVYALGVTLFELLTGKQPYSDKNATKLMMKHVQEPTPSIRWVQPNFDSSVEQVLLSAMAKHPDERYASAGEFAQAVAGLAKLYSR